MQIRYRYVAYGTRFVPSEGARTGLEQAAELLFENEAAADVGGVFWKDGRPVIDHHFAKEGQFPSGCAAVLNSAEQVYGWWENCRGQFGDVWLVTHINPDFDAFASLYLIRSLGEWAGFELGKRRTMDWFSMPRGAADPEVRWRLALAVTASLSDSCRRFGCHKTQSSPAVLYAALRRGRELNSSGAEILFRHFRDAVAVQGMNPVTDAIFEHAAEFAPEVELLAREVPAYERDLRRARQAIVSVPAYQGSFQGFYEPRKETALLDEGLRENAIHGMTDGISTAVDGIYIRDPESLLFKDLARMDTENSSLGQGFLFTAVAYSNGRPEGLVNQSDYYFALDPERTGQRTLYPVWARLQRDEVGLVTAKARAVMAGLDARPEFKGRAGGLGGVFHDPWFDGANYQTTLIATPNRGTAIGPAGKAGDLGDDPVARAVAELLEDGIYAGECRVVTGGDHHYNHGRGSSFRLCLMPLAAGLELMPALQCRQIGRRLWQELHGGAVEMPGDFNDRHLTRDAELIAVWSRQGVAIAYRPEASGRVEKIAAEFQKLVLLLETIREITGNEKKRDLEKSEKLLYEVAVMRQELSLPDHLIAFRRFVDAIGLHETLATVRDLMAAGENKEIAAATQTAIEAVREGQQRVEMLEILFVTLYSIELINILLERLAKAADGVGLVETRLLCGLGVFVAGIVLWGLAPKKRRAGKWNPISLIPGLTILLLVVAIAATFYPVLGWYRELVR